MFSIVPIFHYFLLLSHQGPAWKAREGATIEQGTTIFTNIQGVFIINVAEVLYIYFIHLLRLLKFAYS